MCVSGVVKIVFTVALLLGTGLLIASILTPWWRNVQVEKSVNGAKEQVEKDYSMGLLGLFCGKGTTPNTDSLAKACEKNFLDKPTWEQATLVCMVGSVGFCLLALVWTLVFCCACCCDSCLTPPLAILTGLATVLSVVGLTVFCVENNQNPFKENWQDPDVTAKTQMAASIWLGAAGSACLGIATIVSICLIKMQKTPLGHVV